MRRPATLFVICVAVYLATFALIRAFDLNIVPLADVEVAPLFWSFSAAFLLRIIETTAAVIAMILLLLGALYGVGVPLGQTMK
ncbi:MAG: hypothetical protein NTV56_15080 [Alphaproteobacteria bacterium]|nr:hypothetical protein [Alphaproteobacteria bacterium]